MNLLKKVITYRSKDYFKSVKLRDIILRKPLGLKFKDEYLAQDEKEFMLGLFLDKDILATLNLRPISDKSVRMRQVAVSEKFQGKGIGRQLVDFSESFCKKKGFEEIILHARDNAIPFYKKLNYEVTDPEYFIEVGIKHLKMRKILN